MIASVRRMLPHLGVLTCALITVVVSALGMQMRASWRLGVPLKFRADHVWMLLRSGNPIEPARPLEPDGSSLASRIPEFIEYRNHSFTDDPIWFCGDSQLEYFCAYEAVTDSQTTFFQPVCTAQLVLRRLARGDAATAKVAIIHIGIGDLTIDLSGEGLLKGYREILEKLANKKVLLILPEALSENRQSLRAERKAFNARLRDVRPRIAALCSAYPNVRVVDITPRIVDSTGSVCPHLLREDDAHLNGKGHDILWAAIKEKLGGWVQERQPERQF
jgi:lysophospholipase L1-like esterase